MTVFNLGSINADYTYRVPHLPKPGETLAAIDMRRGLGGKGANQSIAAARAGAAVVHIGSVGADGLWAVEALRAAGVNVSHVTEVDAPTGHAIIAVEPSGENAIVLLSGANQCQDGDRILSALEYGKPSDICILQNEVNLVFETATFARTQGMRVVYSAAPFDAAEVIKMLPVIDILVVNEVEAEQVAQALCQKIDRLPVAGVLVTRGKAGAWYMEKAAEPVEVPAFMVEPVDTTGAGDTYLGYFVAGLHGGMAVAEAMRFAAAGAAIQVTRPGTAEAIPGRAETLEFMSAQR